MTTEGFYSLIDAYAVDDVDDDVAMMRPLTGSEVRSWAPNGRPTREQWEAALPQLLNPVGRGIGRCTVLYQDGEPAEIAYWGCTAD
ncbi:hypothetical protein ACIG5E_09190 [Kitasatospora sp. NPDC053057]|uniref:hypothetical protein n=1 Tax=Kitasatospora sp. NPDC053057 TaxID=3364062 RepID=UPI0037C50E42